MITDSLSIPKIYYVLLTYTIFIWNCRRRAVVRSCEWYAAIRSCQKKRTSAGVEDVGKSE